MSCISRFCISCCILFSTHDIIINNDPTTVYIINHITRARDGRRSGKDDRSTDGCLQNLIVNILELIVDMIAVVELGYTVVFLTPHEIAWCASGHLA